MHVNEIYIMIIHILGYVYRNTHNSIEVLLASCSIYKNQSFRKTSSGLYEKTFGLQLAWKCNSFWPAYT